MSATREFAPGLRRGYCSGNVSTTQPKSPQNACVSYIVYTEIPDRDNGGYLRVQLLFQLDP
jgi:hypothetical protein